MLAQCAWVGAAEHYCTALRSSDGTNPTGASVGKGLTHAEGVVANSDIGRVRRPLVERGQHLHFDNGKPIATKYVVFHDTIARLPPTPQPPISCARSFKSSAHVLVATIWLLQIGEWCTRLNLSSPCRRALPRYTMRRDPKNGSI